jgi:hypothetical protein
MAAITPTAKLPEPNPDEVRYIPVGQLLLDSQNPRLTWRVDGDSQEDLVKILWAEMAVDEVALSIAENGFFRSEPLFVVIKNPNEQDAKKRKYVVLEGNRRLAAVLLLRDKKLREKVGATNLPDVDEAKLRALNELPAIIYANKRSIWTSLGFRHINGIKPWDSSSKAKYVAEVHENYGVSLQEIAQKIGDRHATVERLYRGYKILEQAESQAGFDKEDRARNRFYFSHLYTAADQPEFQRFLGISSETSLEPNPVPKSNLTELGELMTWLYGRKSEGVEPVIRTQNPDLNILREVIGKPESLSALRGGYSLERAHAIAIGDKRRFRDALTSAKIELQNAKATVTTGYGGEEDLYGSIQEIILYAESIKEEMETKRGGVSIGGREARSGPRARKVERNRRD